MNSPESKHSLRKCSIVAAALVGGLLLSCGGLTILSDWPKNGILVYRLEADMKEQLPIGSTWEQAEAWFASHGIRPNGIYGLPDDRKVGLGAIIPNESFLTWAEIRIELYFSPEGRLEKQSIYRFVPSL